MSVCVLIWAPSGLELTLWKSSGNISVSEHKSAASIGGGREKRSGVVELSWWVVTGETRCYYEADESHNVTLSCERLKSIIECVGFFIRLEGKIKGAEVTPHASHSTDPKEEKKTHYAPGRR